MTPATRLIVNADDYGRSLGVSRGILEAHQRGIVTSTTVLINQPGIRAQLEEALACPRLGLGLHLAFTAPAKAGGLSDWRPVLPPELVPDWVDQDGLFLEQHTVWARAERLDTGQLRAELAAQAARFEALAGRPPDHLDCHHFVHLYPPFFAVYADLAQRLAVPLRVPFPPEADIARAVRTLSFLEGFPLDLVRGLIVTNTALLRARRLAHPDHFCGTFFGREALTLDFLLGLLDTLPPGVTELMCHPGYDDPALEGSSYRAEREVELALLCHPAVQARLAGRGIELITFEGVGPGGFN